MTEKELEAISKAISESKKSISEDAGVHPLVGASIIHNQEILETAYRGELAKGEHAEYTLLERKLVCKDLKGATLITTLEPCTVRNHPKSPCASRIISRNIQKVIIGMLDPNEDIYGTGILQLRTNGIKVDLFPPNLAKEVREDNKRFIELHTKISTNSKNRRLDDWFCAINRIYFNTNFYRSTESIFSHLVEIMGGLSLLATGKFKPGVEPEQHLAKAIAWWLALCGKLSIRSVEDLLWYKFPYVCPYCRTCPHNDDKCSEEKEKGRKPKWEELIKIGLKQAGKRPNSLGDWLVMFNKIYPANQTESYDIIFGRFTEELGELSEAVRVGSLAPGYIISEAADVFAWLMKLGNTYGSKQKIPSDQRGEQIESWVQREYPDKCVVCGYSVCTCPPVLQKTLGRIAHDGPSADLLAIKNPFLSVNENSARFDISSNQIVVGDKVLLVTEDLVNDVADVTRGLLDQLQGGLFDSETEDRLRGAIQKLGSFSANKHLNKRHVDNLLRIVLLMPSNEQRSFRNLLNEGSPDSWEQILCDFIDKAISQTES